MPDVDILVAGWKTVYWARLQLLQMERLKPKATFKYVAWENSPTVPEAKWLSENVPDHYLCMEGESHPRSMELMMERTSSPIVAMMDVDCVPIKEGWLDEAVEALDDPKIGVAGVVNDRPHGRHRPFVHPAYMVFKRKTYEDLRCSLRQFRYWDGDFFDIASLVSMQMEENGYKIKNLGVGHSRIPTGPATATQKVVHFCASSKVSVGTEPEQIRIRQGIVKNHREKLTEAGLWKDFEECVRMFLPGNPLLNRYLVPNGGE